MTRSRYLGYCWTQTEAASSVEYAVLLGLISTVAIGGIVLLGQRTQSRLGMVEAGLTGAPGTQTTSSSGPPTVNQGQFQWRSYFGTWTMQDGVQTSADRWSMNVADAGMPNYTAAMTLQTTDTGDKNIWDVTRMVYRFQDPNNYYAVVPKTDGTLELAKMQDGAWRPWLAYAQTGLDPTVPHKYEVTVTGGRSQISVDGVKYIDYVDSKKLPVGGGVGVANSSSQGTFGNVTVSKP